MIYFEFIFVKDVRSVSRLPHHPSQTLFLACGCAVAPAPRVESILIFKQCVFSTLADVARRIPQIDKHEVPREKGRADAEPDKNGKEQANKPNLSAQTLSKMSD